MRKEDVFPKWLFKEKRQNAVCIWKAKKRAFSSTLSVLGIVLLCLFVRSIKYYKSKIGLSAGTEQNKKITCCGQKRCSWKGSVQGFDYL